MESNMLGGIHKNLWWIFSLCVRRPGMKFWKAPCPYLSFSELLPLLSMHSDMRKCVYLYFPYCEMLFWDRRHSCCVVSTYKMLPMFKYEGILPAFTQLKPRVTTRLCWVAWQSNCQCARQSLHCTMAWLLLLEPQRNIGFFQSQHCIVSWLLFESRETLDISKDSTALCLGCCCLSQRETRMCSNTGLAPWFDRHYI